MKNNKRYQKALNPDKFLSYTIDSKERVSSDAFLMTLRPEEHDPTVPILYLSDPVNPANPASSTGAWKYPLWSVEVKQPEIQIVREYTPLPPASAAEAKAGILHFLPSPIAQRLQALKAAHGNRFDVRVAVTGEDAVIGEAEIKAALGISANARAGATPAQARAGPYLPVASGPYSEHQPKVVARPGGSGAYKLVLVSGPDGFVDRYAGIIKEDNAPAFRRIRQGGMANEIIDRYSSELDGEWQVVNLD
ncbi:hypothetical protein CFO_g511 [Ceratocystis platani]|uniref:Uncharacterized protein n=1 Tax=Ceratocystis fimbriata f. sp. platani TaxID=88771 RepID=A0A0F8B868_CERFI|nr:hypothetical protein CFO_g511 [Ceratocystis platani]